MNQFDLTGKIALVTGGGTGIGLMMAKGLASNGAKVYITGRRLEVLRKSAAEHRFEGSGQLIPIQMDVDDKQSISNAEKLIEQADGRLDVLINNAGTSGPIYSGTWSNNHTAALNTEETATYGRELFDQGADHWDAVHHTNVASVFFVTTAFLGLLAKSAQSKEGRMASVINITSVFKHSRMHWCYHAYDCTKAAVGHLTTMFATDMSLRRIPIRVNAISPGTFSSEMTSTEENLKQAMQTNFLGALQPNPLRRPGKEEEIAALAVYLASDASAYVQGQEIGIDAGFGLVNP
ncbi:short-chain dehydrogenase [Fomitiporia mediterranea MF3/22]|uniref:short-chain dehydrogenase n=1 Tax=Fomitiporia mediterranea (strain MF3/22) TaxID=694068 RepID=UPI0004407997|nr:short-chain dehydrogenase [Fomitiporia mediterranea MF3/22]EJD07556.1 short-chain dehydrogenase [Fomitiporia mediterranea MF3/22]